MIMIVIMIMIMIIIIITVIKYNYSTYELLLTIIYECSRYYSHLIIGDSHPTLIQPKSERTITTDTAVIGEMETRYKSIKIKIIKILC